ncbi:pilus assembly protein [Sphingomonas aracearum]|uniref:Pilus assembly protein n=1 Tax=Sphingomonas aracearum TaxID=2283317 RepID=A0A369VW63_9SPHN|nr:pilus assembly protein [Sphingomonas aracearum]
MMRRGRALLSRLYRARRGVALIEFALVLPILLTLSLTGAELTNYITIRMRISQLALHLADNAARIGAGTRREAKKIYESDIYDLVDGAQLQSGKLDLLRNGRIIVSSLESMPAPNTANKSRIRWQRCAGSKTSHASAWGVAGATNLDGMGPSGRQAVAPQDGVTMFVEVYYEYKPLISATRLLLADQNITEIASMMVRDRRDTGGANSGIYPVAGVTPKTC